MVGPGTTTSTSIENVALSAIDQEDTFYSCAPDWWPLDELRQSIHRVGILNPLRLETKDNGMFRIISGFRRLRVARRLGLEYVPCRLESTESPLAAFCSAIWENSGGRTFEELEKAEILSKLTKVFKIEASTLLDEYLLPLGIRPSRQRLLHYLKVAELPESLKLAIVKSGLLPETAVGMSGWGNEEQGLFVQQVSGYRLGRNKQRLLYSLIDELRTQKACDFPTLWRLSGASRLVSKEGPRSDDRFRRVYSALRALRFPVLTEYEEKYRQLKSELELPPQILLQVPEYFEGSQITITLRAHSAAELRNLSHRLQESCSSSVMDRIFELI